MVNFLLKYVFIFTLLKKRKRLVRRHDAEKKEETRDNDVKTAK